MLTAQNYAHRRSRSHDRHSAGAPHDSSTSLGRNILRADEYCLKDRCQPTNDSLQPPPKPSVSLASKLSRSFYDLAQNDRLSKWKSKLTSGSPLFKRDKSKEDLRSVASTTPVHWQHAPSVDQLHQPVFCTENPHIATNVNKQATTQSQLSNRVLKPISCKGDGPPSQRKLEYSRQSLQPNIGSSTHNMSHSTQLAASIYYDNNRLTSNHKTSNSTNYNTNSSNKNVSIATRVPASRSTEPRAYEDIDLLWPVPAADEREADSRTLPPPARITPFSGVVPHNKSSDLVRPVAFRALNQPSPEKDVMQSFEGTQYGSGHRLNPVPPVQYSVNRHSTPNELRHSSGELHQSTYVNQRPLSIQNGSGAAVDRRRAMYHRSDDENDYDTVPEFVELLKEHLVTDKTQTQDTHRKSSSSLHNDAVSDYATSRLSSELNRVASQQSAQRASGITGTKHRTEGSGSSSGYRSGSFASSRQSSGAALHMPPSPPDPGLTGLEAVLRDKDAELMHLRSYMEQNEDVIVNVYKEKEQRWQTELRDMQTKLRQATHNENKLLHEIQRLRDDNKRAQNTVQTLAAEKQGLNRTCKNLEAQMFDAKSELRSLQNGRLSGSGLSLCRSCNRDVNAPNPHGDSCSSTSQTGSDRNTYPSAFALDTSSRKSCTPKPSGGSMSDSVGLRAEVDTLSSEVHSLQHTLSEHMHSFNCDRQRWNDEKQQMLQYQKTLQYNFLQLSQRHQELQQRVMPESSSVGSRSDRARIDSD